jgi:hypothetical protein
MKRVFSVFLISLIFYSLVEACEIPRDSRGHIKRSSAAVVRFKKGHPCPSKGATKGTCPGYVVDHIVPLCACGLDDQSNMQWQTKEEAKQKDKKEREMCR